MTDTKFEKNVTYMLQKVKSTLCYKKKEYSNKKDRLQGFKHAATFMRGTPKQALFAMMAKHLTSISDAIYDDVNLTMMQWDEKITDMINYLLLLRALVLEEKEVNNDTTSV